MSQQLTEKQQYWSEMLKTADSSGITFIQFAHLNQVTANELYRWRNQLKKYTPSPDMTKPNIKQVVATSYSATPCLSIKLHKRSYSFNVLPDPKWLARLLVQQSLPA